MSAEEDCVAAEFLALIAATDPLPGTDLPVEEHAGDGAARSFNVSQWSSFCQRVKAGLVTPTCVIDFAYSDGGALQNADRQLERMYCFDDVGASCRVVLHVHTPFRWGDRKQKHPKARTEFVTSANVRHAWQKRDGSFEQEQGKWFLVPLARKLQQEWRALRENEIRWQWNVPGSIPPAERSEGPVTRAMSRYDDVRRTIQLGESLGFREYAETLSWTDTENAMRGGWGWGEREYEVVAMAPGGASRKSAGRARSALIVAVSSYASDNVSNLANTIIDAAKLQGALFKLGWSVEMALELGLEQAEKKVEEFAGRGAKGDDDCLFAFVGHGVELNGRNYLVAADSKFDAAYESEAKFEKAVKRGCLPFDDVQGDFKNARGSSAGATVFLLDCCRSGFSTNVGSGRSVAGCFTSRAADSSAIRPEFPNSIVIYSTTSGKVASDGVRGEGGPFMGIFCEEIASGAEVSVVMKSTRKKLLASAPDLCQLAPDNSFLLDDFFFSPQREQQDEAASGASHMVPARPGGTASGGGDDALLLLLREHDVEDAAAWLQREGATSRKHLLDVTEEDVHAAGLQKFVARRLVRMLAGLRDAAGGGGRAEAPVQVSLEGGEMETGVAGGGGVGPSENGVVQVLEESTDVAETVAAMVGGEAVLKAMEGGDGVGPRASHPPAPQSAAPPSAAPPPPPLHPPPDLEAGEASLAAEAPEPLSRDSTEVAKLELVGKEDTSEDVAQVVHLVGLDAARAGDKFTFAAALRRAIKRQDGRDYQPREQVFRAVSLSKVPSTHKKPPPP